MLWLGRLMLYDWCARSAFNLTWKTRYRQYDRKCTALPNCTLNRNPAAVQLSNALRNCEAKAASALCAAPPSVHTVKAIEQTREMLRCNPRPSVADADANRVICPVAIERNLSAGRGVADRIIQQVQEQVNQVILIPIHDPRRF